MGSLGWIFCFHKPYKAVLLESYVKNAFGSLIFLRFWFTSHHHFPYIAILTLVFFFSDLFF